MAAAGPQPEGDLRARSGKENEQTEKPEARRDQRDADLLPYLDRYETARKEHPLQQPRERLRQILDLIVDPQLKLHAAEALLDVELDWRLRDSSGKIPIQRQEFDGLLPEFSQTTERVFPSTIGGYEITGIIGQGQFGRVYIGIDPISKGIFAIKVLFNDFREITLPRINHMRVVQAIKTGKTEDGHLFLVMPYIDGGNLGHYLEKNCKLQSKQYLELRQAVDIIRQIVEELVEIHREMIHRDLKPENILLDKDLNVYVADLGMALLQEERQFEHARMTTAGTLPYMAPEMLIHAAGDLTPKAPDRPESRPALTAAADLWAVGVIMYQLLINEYPFGSSQTDWKGIYANLGEAPQFPTARRPDLPVGLEKICLKCLHIDRKERYGSAKQLLDDLNNIASVVWKEIETGFQARERTGRSKVIKERRRQVVLDVVTGLLVIFFLLLIKLRFETTTPGKLLDGMLYCWVQTRFPVAEAHLPVVLVDISSLDSHKQAGRPTPRAQLEKLLDQIIERAPAAIGIDIDFSPDYNFSQADSIGSGWTERGGPQFFDYIHQQRTPIYLGVDRQRYSPPDQWLGAEDYASLGVNIVIPRDDNRHMPLWISRGNSSSCQRLAADVFGIDTEPNKDFPKASCLPAMAVALASKYSDRQRVAAYWLSRFAHPFHEELLSNQDRIYASLFYPDYGVVKYVKEQMSTVIVSEKGVQLVLNPNISDLRGKVILLGNTSWPKTPDKYPIPPWQREVPGVYFHAAATYTLIEGPLMEISEGARIVLDLLLSSIILFAVSWLRLFYSSRTTAEVASHRLRFVLTSVATAGVLVGGYGFVHYTRILWTDSLLVSVALLLHSFLERHLRTCVVWAGVTAPRIMTWLLLDNREERP